MLVSVFSDASFCVDFGIATWAGWVKSDRGRVIHGGVFDAEIGTVFEAEIGAAVNAIALGLSQGVIEAGDRVLVQSDNVAALDHLERCDPTDTLSGRFAEWVLTQTREHSLVFLWRHVKAHAGYEEPRSAVNEMVDSRARLELRRERDRIRRQDPARARRAARKREGGAGRHLESNLGTLSLETRRSVENTETKT